MDRQPRKRPSARRRSSRHHAAVANEERETRKLYAYALLSLTAMQVLSLALFGVLTATLDPSHKNGPMHRMLHASVSRGDDGVIDDILTLELLEEINLLDDDNNETKPLDDYYSRQHITSWKKKPPILIVGGSDGSGTRAVVDTLMRLGVPMIVDDAGTMDIHASGMFDGAGWPPLVQLVMNATHTANYMPGDLDVLTHREAHAELFSRFYHQYEKKGEKAAEEALSQHDQVAQAVHYGFKAPISMLLLPLLKQLYGSIKFVHVVRDGRDVALSSNQSSVNKFFDSFYPDSEERRKLYDQSGNESLKEIMAMQLWNDWNTQALDWERQHSDGRTLDYLVVRTEDLVNPLTKFESLAQMSDFVGAAKTLQQLCCFSQQPIADMGQSSHAPPRTKNILNSLWNDPALRGEVVDKVAEKKKRADFRHQHRSSQSALEKFEAEREERMRHRNAQRHRRLLGSRPFGTLADLKEELGSQPTQEEEDAGVATLSNNLTVNGERWKQMKDLRDRMTHEVRNMAGRGRSRQESPEKVQHRYGKWVSALADRPELSALLHSEGAVGLETFGYEPSVRFLDRAPASNFVCDENVECDERFEL